MDDSTQLILTVESEDYIEGWLRMTHPALIVQCSEHRLQAWIDPKVTSQPEGALDKYTVRLRIDAGPVTKGVASEASNGHALSIGDAPFVWRLVGAKRLTFQLTPFRSNPGTASFDLSGLGRFAASLRQACPDPIPTPAKRRARRP